MNGKMWKVTIRLRPEGAHQFMFETRGEDGTLVRSPGKFDSIESLKESAQVHLDGVRMYDPALHARVDELARQAAKSAVDTFSHKAVQ